MSEFLHPCIWTTQCLVLFFNLQLKFRNFLMRLLADIFTYSLLWGWYTSWLLMGINLYLLCSCWLHWSMLCHVFPVFSVFKCQCRQNFYPQWWEDAFLFHARIYALRPLFVKTWRYTHNRQLTKYLFSDWSIGMVLDMNEQPFRKL